jgi:hypothetical protein
MRLHSTSKRSVSQALALRHLQGVSLSIKHPLGIDLISLRVLVVCSNYGQIL